MPSAESGNIGSYFLIHEFRIEFRNIQDIITGVFFSNQWSTATTAVRTILQSKILDSKLFKSKRRRVNVAVNLFK